MDYELTIADQCLDAIESLTSEGAARVATFLYDRFATNPESVVAEPLVQHDELAEARDIFAERKAARQSEDVYRPENDPEVENVLPGRPGAVTKGSYIEATTLPNDGLRGCTNEVGDV